jgi:hypothetical protein
MNWISSFYLRYAALGFSVIPIKTLAYADRNDHNKDAKRPLVRWMEYQKKAATPDQLLTWALKWPLAGPGILTGLLSDLFVVDDDRKGRPPLEAHLRSSEQEIAFQRLIVRYSSEAEVVRMYIAADEFCEALAQLETAIACTSKGKHYYFKMPRDENGFQISIGDSVKFLPGLDTRAEGGYVLAPPSIHPSGTAYIWERSPEEGILPLPQWVYKAIVELPAERRFVSDFIKPSLPGTLRPNAPQPLWLSGFMGVSEGERNSAAASYAGKILEGTSEEYWPRAFEVLIDWNEQNSPPLGAKELLTTWNSLKAREVAKRGTSSQSLVQPHIFGSEPELITAKALDIRDLHAPDFAVKDFIVDGTTQLFGKPKAGKSFLAMQIACAVALGRPLFKSTASMYAYANHPGGFATHQGDVLYLALEDSYLRLQTRMRLIMGGDGPPEKLQFINEWENCHEGGLARIERWLVQVKHARLVVIDTIAAFMGATGNKAGGSVFRAEYRMFRPIWELGQRYKVPFLLVDHASKSKGKFGSGDPFDSGAGTLGSQAAVDTVMIMEHDDKRPMARLSMKGRDVERGFIDLEHTKDSPIWKLASEPIVTESKTTKPKPTEDPELRNQASEAHQNSRIARSVDPFRTVVI